MDNEPIIIIIRNDIAKVFRHFLNNVCGYQSLTFEEIVITNEHKFIITMPPSIDGDNSRFWLGFHYAGYLQQCGYISATTI